jgi:hypothetical protein
MPSRVIRGEINSSGSLSRVSMQAELTFDRLLTAVDDYGRYDARPAMLKAGLFPVRAEATPKKIAGWVAELAREGCVLLYEVGGRPYLAMTGWEKHRGRGRRGTESKFPAPAETHSPASEESSDPLEVPGDPPGGRGARDGGREAGGGFNAATPPPKTSSGSARKQKAPCPENPTEDQWARIDTWRDTKHPEFPDRELEAQWILHYQHHGAKGNLRADWVLSFYNWLTGPFYKPATSGAQSASTPNIFKADLRPRPKPATKEQWTSLGEELDAIRKGTRLRPRNVVRH